jgi:hypothetical protein
MVDKKDPPKNSQSLQFLHDNGNVGSEAEDGLESMGDQLEGAEADGDRQRVVVDGGLD